MMKQLILGIDGGDLELFRKLPMPFLHSLIDQNVTLNLKEDLLSRGWAEIISGKKAEDNKSFYIMPKLDGTNGYTLKYSFDDLKANSNEPFIWEIAEDNGCNIGIMNIPTTYPSPSVKNGFFISGAGGGLYKVAGVPAEMCSSEAIREFLERNGYIIELRFRPSGINEVNHLFFKMNEMMTKRFQIFTQLAQDHKIDFGFLALRATANLLYVIMYEVETFIKSEKQAEVWKANIHGHFTLLDSLIQDLFKRFNPENFIMVSDHGMSPQRYHVNFNVFLEQKGLLSREKHSTLGLRAGFKRLRNGLYNSFGFNYLDTITGSINWADTSVFGNWYSNGLYINDKKRFNGPVLDGDINDLTEKVCDLFNQDPESQAHGFRAKTHRSNFKDSKFYDLLPDIWIEAPSEYFFLNSTRKYITKNIWYKPIKSLKHVPSSMFTGIKGKTPICVMNKELASHIKDTDALDLTLVYKITQRYFNSKE